MATWTPLTLFGVSIVFASVAALGSLLLSDKDLSPRSIIATVMFHGPLGSAVAMAAYEYFSLENTPWTALALAIAYGAGIIQLSEIKAIAGRVLKGVIAEDPNDK